MRRVAVVGNTGSGKTTFAAALAARLDVRHVELDQHYHLPGWAHLSSGAFRHRVRQALDGGGWVVDGNYGGALGGLVLDQADTVVWLDYPLTVTLPRLARRTVRRARTAEPICNGNVETWGNLVRNGGIVRWSLSAHRKYQRRYAGLAQTDPRFVRLRSPAEADAFLASLSGDRRGRRG
jgi:adenylate kinase family enzyme